MPGSYLEPTGIVVQPSSLALPRAKALAEAVGGRGLPFVKFVECRQYTVGGQTAETVVFDVEVERPQRPVNDIRRVERISVTFAPSDDYYPEVLALRDNFPRVPHTNLRLTEYPRSLCLYDQPWEQIALRLTAAALIERIRFWLAETAKGSLHQDDQPLEQLIVGSKYTIVLPPDLFMGTMGGQHEELHVRLAARVKDCRLLIAKRGGKNEGGMPFVALSFTAKPQTHGAIRHAPHSLAELDSFVRPHGIMLLEALRTKVAEWDSECLREKPILLVLAFPVTRNGQDIVEANHLWVFGTTKTVADVGVDLGVLEKTTHGYGRLLGGAADRNGQNIPLDVILPQFDITREYAAAASETEVDRRRAVAVGAGALGSQIIKTLAQTGFGDWCVIDEDILQPHNIVRHELGRWAIGAPKAFSLVGDVNSIFEENGQLRWFEADVIKPGEDAGQIGAEFAAAELILDLAASIPASRHLALSVESPARRMAAFLNPRGTDLVLLAEGAHREVPLDCLEMQYYRAIVSDARLDGHLRSAEGRIRYARSCRDVSSTLPNHLVKVHAGTAVNALRRAIAGSEPLIRIWQADPETGEVLHTPVPVAAVERSNLYLGWTLVVDHQLTARIAEFRKAKLPNETGGVLMGAYDLARKLVYVVETIPSPPDSEEWPTLYIRGKKGLKPKVDRIQELTGGQLEYVGEWHSHPDGCPCRPSNDDLKVFGWLTKNMDDAGLPALMGIAGDDGYTEWYLGQMLRTGGWRVGK